jgi:hypothetical protein
MRLTIYTKGKRWEFTHDNTDWVIGDTWVEVRTAQNKTFLFPVHDIRLMIITFPKEKETKTQGGQQK